MFLGADVDGLDQMAQRCELAAGAADAARTALAAAAAAPWVFGPFGAAFCAYLNHEAVPRLAIVAEALRRFAAVLRAHAAAQRQASAGGSVGALPRYETPALPGGGGRVSFTERARTNRVRITAEADRLRAEVATLERQRASYGLPLGGFAAARDYAIASDIKAKRERLATYDRLLAENRQIIYFDPAGDGAIAELHGTIGPNTRNVGILVPGTSTDIDNFDNFSQRGRGFVDANPQGDLAVVVWMGGDLPDGLLLNAPSPSYANTLGPQLAAFSHDLRQEIAGAGPGGGTAQVTVAGHSYGGAVVGTAERFGLDADRVLHIESAGMGRGVDGPEDYSNPRPDVRRYSLTAPGDPIDLTQGRSLFGAGHGADPDSFPGVLRLDTGVYPDGRLVEGLAAHDGVFTPGSDSWRNMNNVFTGGTVTEYQPPRLVPQGGYGLGPPVSLVRRRSLDPPQQVDIP